jgi:NAD(P)-dependent dehydrogenase (short-subunit alcohol dehydrogenase family)
MFTAIVTGGARGIGEAIATRLAADGGRIAILDRDVERAQRVATSIDGCCIGVDLADSDLVAAACHRAAEQLGGCDVLVNNAGLFATSGIVDADINMWDTIMAVNARAPMLTMAALLPRLQSSHRGAVINIASMAAKLGTPGEAAYATSKAALVALSRIAAMEFGPDAITVNALCPGYVLTEMGSATRTADMVAQWSAQSPLGRCTEPAEVADLVAFLASPQARGITGQAINITAGMVTW